MLLIALTMTAALQAVPVQMSDADLRTALLRADDLFHSTMFRECDPEALSAITTEDMEFYHDKGGSTRGQALFVARHERACRDIEKDQTKSTRRQLRPETFKVHRVPGFGAITEGTHEFYEPQHDGSEKLIGTSRFVILWALGEDGQWRMSRSMNTDYDLVLID